MPKKRARRKPRPGVPPEARRFDDLLRDLESVRRRMRNYRSLILDMSLLSAAMRRQMAVAPDEEPNTWEETPPTE